MTKEKIFEMVKAEYEKLMDLPMGGDPSRQMARNRGQVVGMLKAFRMMGYLTAEEVADMVDDLI